MRFFLAIFTIITLGCTTPSSVMTLPKAEKQLRVDNNFASSQLFQLAAPILTIEDRLFTEKTTARLALNYPNTAIFYTLDGEEPTANSFRYTEAITITKSGTLKAKAIHPDHLPSNTVAISFLKIGQLPKVKAITLSAAPHKNYAGRGKETLFDQKKGSLNFRTIEWLGFNGDDVEVLVELKDKNNISQLTVSVLSDVGSWIFPPSGVEIWAMNKAKMYDLVAEKSYAKLAKATPPDLQFLTLNFESINTQNLKIVIRNNGSIPDWHDGKGTPAWLFLDELILQ